MFKKVLSLTVLLGGGTWAQAQSVPGYAVISSDPGTRSGSVGNPSGPPEPAAVGGPSALPIQGGPQGPGGYLPSGPGASYPPMPGGSYPPMPGGPGMTYPGGPGMGYPQMPGGGPGMMGMTGPGMMPGPGPGMPGPGMPAPGNVPMLPMGPMGMPDGSPMGDGFTVGPKATFGSETFFFSMGYAAGWLTKPRLAEPLITEGNPSDAHPGALGQEGTVVAFGDNNYKFGTYNGLNASMGVNLNDQWYLELNALVFPSERISWTTGSDANGNPLVARPVFNAQNGGAAGSFLTSLPGTVAGSTSINASSQLWGFEAVARYKFALTPYLTGDFMFGYRQMELDEYLNISDSVTPLVPSFTFLGTAVNPAPGQTYINDFDHFSTNNMFYGADFGLRLRWQSGYDWLSTTAYVKEALGATTQTVAIGGATTLVQPTGSSTAPGGILAQASNIGNYTRTVFGDITEGGVGIVITPWKWMRFEVGYSAIYWNSVARPGNQINYNVSYSQVPTSQAYTGPGSGNQPNFSFHSQGVTVQTLNLGLSFYY